MAEPDPLKNDSLLSNEGRAELLARVSAAGLVGFWDWDPGTRVAEWDSGMRQILGIDDTTEASAELWLSMVHPHDQKSARGAPGATGPGRELRHRIVRHDGVVRHVIVRSEELEPSVEAGRVTGLVVDVTESQEASSLIVNILESISDAYAALSHDWRFTYANRRAELVLGQPRTEILGRNLWEAFPAIIGSQFEEKYRIAMEDRRPVEFEEFYEPLDAWFQIRVFPVDGGIAVYFQDVTHRHEAEAERRRMLEEEQAARREAEAARSKVEHQATHDSLTDLLNRQELMRKVDEALAEGVLVTLQFFDIDRFKLVNDSLGHAMGDRLLRIVADRLVPFMEFGNLVARFGGDEFVIGLFDWDHVAASALAERILDQVRKPINLDGNLIHATASAGLADSRDTKMATELMLNADVALYRAKDAGRDQAVWFDEFLRDRLLRRVELEQQLRKAIDRDLIRFHFQPAFDLSTGKVSDMEALARWVHDEDGPVSPGEFIPIAEESGLIHQIGHSAVKAVAAMGAAWNRDEHDPITFWANFSASQLVQPDFGPELKATLEELGLDPSCFGIEITESALAGNTNIMRGLHQVADLGIKIAIDDFGTGYSSISRLNDLPVDILKIDRSFINRLEEPGGTDTVAAIVNLAHALDATVIAEGIETTTQLEALRQTRCDRAAGYLLARPLPAEGLQDAITAGEQVLAGAG